MVKSNFIKDLRFNENIELLCFVSNKRNHKNIIFLDLYDSTGCIEAVATVNECKNFSDIERVTKESAVLVKG